MKADAAAGERAEHFWAGGTAAVAALSLLAVLLAAIPLLLLEPDADGGAPVFVAVLGIPAVPSR